MDYSEVIFKGKKAIRIQTDKLQMTIVTECGPRISSFGRKDGKNLLFWDEKNLGRKEWKLMGGHRVWACRPGADESEDAYLPDNEECRVSKSPGCITVTGSRNASFNIERGIRFKLMGEKRICVDNFITNRGDMLYSAGVWALTCTVPEPDRRYGIPLGNGSEWDTFRVVFFRSWAGHTSQIDDPQISLTDDMLTVKPRGIETKRMVEAPRGIIAMDSPDEDTTFIKKVTYDPGAQYPLGCNIAFYVAPGNFLVEMETMGPQVTLKPGDTAFSQEIWTLTDKATGLDTKELIKHSE